MGVLSGITLSKTRKSEEMKFLRGGSGVIDRGGGGWWVGGCGSGSMLGIEGFHVGC